MCNWCGIPNRAACTNAVEATWVVFVATAAVGAAGVPVNVGEASGALSASAVVVAESLAFAARAAVNPVTCDSARRTSSEPLSLWVVACASGVPPAPLEPPPG
jgi:hypothetical protein